MEIINLSNRKQIELKINEKECVMSLSLKNIQHFQDSNKMGLQKALEKMQNGDLTVILSLIYSMISDKKTGKILGAKYFKDYDELELIEALSPALESLITKEMPQAKNEAEKK